MAMTWKTKFVVSLVLVIAAFLAGYVPGALKTANLRVELAGTQDRLRVLSLLGELGMVLLEVGQNNFGKAREHSTKFFDQVRDAANATDDAKLKATLEAILGQRDAIIADLASLHLEAGPRLEVIYRELYLAGADSGAQATR